MTQYWDLNKLAILIPTANYNLKKKNDHFLKKNLLKTLVVFMNNKIQHKLIDINICTV